MDAVPTELVVEAIDSLHGARHAIPDAQHHVPSSPGLYAIYGDEEALADLDLDRDSQRPLYIGLAEHSLVSRDLGDHFAVVPGSRARTGSSTVRRSFAALLRERLELRAVPRSLQNPGYFSMYSLAGDGDARLTEWMHERLSLAVWPAPPGMAPALQDVETVVIRRLLPPMNLAKNPGKLPRLSAARSGMAAEAAAWTSPGHLAPEGLGWLTPRARSRRSAPTSRGSSHAPHQPLL